MKALYSFYANEKGFVIERQRFEKFVKTQPFVDITVENRRLPINTWPEGTYFLLEISDCEMRKQNELVHLPFPFSLALLLVLILL